jgi:hypothetical protein
MDHPGRITRNKHKKLEKSSENLLNRTSLTVYLLLLSQVGQIGSLAGEGSRSNGH